MILEKEFKYKEELNKYVETFYKTEKSVASYEVIKNDERYKIFLEDEDFIKYIFQHNKHVWFSVVTMERFETGRIEINIRDIYEEELKYMIKKANLI